MSTGHGAQIKENQMSHFQGKEPLQHIVEVQAQGVETSLEIHGAETPGARFSFLDSARETVVFCALMSIALDFFEMSKENMGILFFAWGISWAFWKGARATSLSWMRLERLHRVAREEKHEIETNRDEERQELIALYSAKGFTGSLLEQVVDVLMADQERLLRVMLQEEMGFRLNENQHPVLIGVGAFLGAFFITILGIPAILLLSLNTILIFAILLCGFLGAGYAYYEKNNIVKAGCWSSMIAAVTFTFLSAVMEFLVN